MRSTIVFSSAVELQELPEQICSAHPCAPDTHTVATH
jgi:hypothetical protein